MAAHDTAEETTKNAEEAVEKIRRFTDALPDRYRGTYHSLRFDHEEPAPVKITVELADEAPEEATRAFRRALAKASDREVPVRFER
ncbi:MAG: hypothetical protein BRD47_01545 [Bacteroidetes bacterium QS_8_68_28]|nr:MAG: hypothetical protein BRD47_01545 [Bacteroidetes bacterium QS_8_68_28]